MANIAKFTTLRSFAAACRKAANLFEEHPEKWIRGAAYNAHGGYCMLGAINFVTCGSGGVPDFDDILFDVRVSAKKALGLHYISHFNDDVAKCPADAIRGLRRLARALEHGGKL